MSIIEIEKIKQLDTEFKKTVVCPYCGYDLGSDSEFIEDREYEYECGECERTFYIYSHIEVTFSIRRKKCEGDNGHSYILNEIIEYDQEWCDKHNIEKFMGRNDWFPYKIATIVCKNCFDKQYKDYLLDGKVPSFSKERGFDEGEEKL